MQEETIRVEVAFALPHKQQIVALDVAKGATVEQAIDISGIAKLFPTHDFSQSDTGLFGKSVKRDLVLKEGDRVEIYRPLLIDPKEIRKQRAQKAKQKA